MTVVNNVARGGLLSVSAVKATPDFANSESILILATTSKPQRKRQPEKGREVRKSELCKPDLALGRTEIEAEQQVRSVISDVYFSKS